MNAAIRIGAANRIAAGVTAAYLLDLTRRPAHSPGDRRPDTIRVRRVAAARFGRHRDDCGGRRAGPVATGPRTSWAS